VEVWRVRSALGGNVCAKSLTRSIALSSRLSLEMNCVSNEEVEGKRNLRRKDTYQSEVRPLNEPDSNTEHLVVDAHILLE